MKNILLFLFFAIFSEHVFSVCLTPIARSNYSAYQTLTSSSLNAQLNAVFTRANELPGDCISTSTISRDKLAVGAIGKSSVTTKTANYTATINDDVIIADTTSAPLVITLPSIAGTSGKIFTFKKIGNVVNTLTVIPTGSAKIDGQDFIQISSDAGYPAFSIFSDGTHWRVLKDTPARAVGKLTGVFGHGSTNTKIRYFLNCTPVDDLEFECINVGTAAVNGSGFKIKIGGMYAMTYCDGDATAGKYFGISISAFSLTTSVTSTSEAIHSIRNQVANYASCLTVTAPLKKDDLVRPHTDGTLAGTGSDITFRMTRVSN